MNDIRAGKTRPGYAATLTSTGVSDLRFADIRASRREIVLSCDNIGRFHDQRLAYLYVVTLVRKQLNDTACVGSKDGCETIFVETDLSSCLSIHGHGTFFNRLGPDLLKLLFVDGDDSGR